MKSILPHASTTRQVCTVDSHPSRSRRHLVTVGAPLVVVAFLAFCGIRSIPAQSPNQTLVLTTAAAVHNLTPELAAHARVHLVGTVTYYDPLEHTLFIQDKTGGVYIGTDKAYPIGYGDLISVDGDAASSYRSEVALNPVIERLSRGEHVPSAHTTYAELSSGRFDSKLVTLRGTVRTVDIEPHQNVPILHMDVNMVGGSVEIYQPVSVIDGETISRYIGLNKASLLDSTVEVQGVAGGAFDAVSRLTGIIVYAQTSADVRVLVPPPVNAMELPLTSMANVYQSRQVIDTSHRLRLRGTLTYYKKGDSAVLQQDGKSIFVLTRETKSIPIGNVVDALGFADDGEYAPSLRQAELVDTGQQAHISSQPISYDDAMSGMYSDVLISLTGTLASELHGQGFDTVVIDMGDHLVTGRLEGGHELHNYRIGALIRMTGVCRIVPGGPWRAPSFFHIELRTPADVIMLSSPSWWNVRHLAELVSALVMLALLIAGWAVLLRRRVKQQTKSIERSMLLARKRSTISEHISSNHPLPALLEELCTGVAELLPGAQCRYVLQTSSHSHQLSTPEPEGQLLYATDLLGEGDAVVGRVTIRSAETATVRGNRNEVFSMVTELASLAMRQSLLYQGLIHHSTHDPLTDLPNRRLCEERLREALASATKRHTQVQVAYVDIDRFKYVNDRFGHKVGDLYLKAISLRFKEQIRGEDTLARIGGDEFMIVAPHTAAGSHPNHLSDRLKSCFNQPFMLDGQQINGSASIGVATFPEHGTSPEDLKRYADHAMYLAKRSNASADPGAAPQISILTAEEIELALERDQFRLAYQPQFGSDGSLRAIEALLRLEDSILGTLTPDAFISVAERSDIILNLGRWVLEQAVQDAVRWQFHIGPPVLLVVNVAMRQLLQPEFASMVLAVLDSVGFPPTRLELELTERTLVTQSEEMSRQLELVRSAGVRISLDDFGTGHSSLSLLHRLPVDTIKVDRSFISAMEVEPNILPVIEAITCMAQRLGKRIVAEGVETTAPISALLRLGEMDFQGYLLSRPVLAEDVVDVLQQWKSGLVMEPEFRTRQQSDHRQ